MSFVIKGFVVKGILVKIGVLAVQGDFDAHRKRLEELGAEVVLVRKPEQLDGIDGLVIPGGESGAFLRILGEKSVEKLKEFVRRSNGMAVSIISGIGSSLAPCC